MNITTTISLDDPLRYLAEIVISKIIIADEHIVHSERIYEFLQQRYNLHRVADYHATIPLTQYSTSEFDSSMFGLNGEKIESYTVKLSENFYFVGHPNMNYHSQLNKGNPLDDKNKQFIFTKYDPFITWWNIICIYKNSTVGYVEKYTLSALLDGTGHELIKTKTIPTKKVNYNEINEYFDEFNETFF